MLAAGKSMPVATSTINGATFNWSRIVTAGGNHVVSGSALFTKVQAIWDPRITWAGGVARHRQPIYWAGTGIAPGTFVMSFVDSPAANQTLLSASVVRADALAGISSSVGRTGAFIPTATLSGWLVGGSGMVLSEGLILSEGLVLSEALTVPEEGLVIYPASSCARQPQTCATY